LATAIRVFLALCSAFLLSQLQRASLSVIAPDLMADVGMTPEGYGLVASGIFIGVLIGQIPVGVLLDRYGARKTTAGLQLLAVFSTLAFAAADSVSLMFAARLATGIGFSASLMGTMVVVARWFPADRFALISALVLAGAGGIGSLLASTPMALLADWLGWRGTFYLLAGATMLSTSAVYLFVIDAPEGHPYHRRRNEGLRESLAGLVQVMRLPQLPYVLMLTTIGFSTLMTILGVWGGPYLHDVHGLNAVERGNVLALLAIGNIIGFLAYGPLDRILDTRKRIILTGGAVNSLLLATLALAPGLDYVEVSALFFALGFVGSYHVANLALGRALFPDALVGRGMTLINLFTFLGLAGMQIIAGLIVGHFVGPDGNAPPQAYRLMFGFMAAASALVIAIYTRVRDIRPSEQRRRFHSA
jgi:MFS family permease